MPSESLSRRGAAIFGPVGAHHAHGFAAVEVYPQWPMPGTPAGHVQHALLAVSIGLALFSPSSPSEGLRRRASARSSTTLDLLVQEAPDERARHEQPKIGIRRVQLEGRPFAEDEER